MPILYRPFLGNVKWNLSVWTIQIMVKNVHATTDTLGLTQRRNHLDAQLPMKCDAESLHGNLNSFTASVYNLDAITAHKTVIYDTVLELRGLLKATPFNLVHLSEIRGHPTKTSVLYLFLVKLQNGNQEVKGIYKEWNAFSLDRENENASLGVKLKI